MGDWSVVSGSPVIFKASAWLLHFKLGMDAQELRDRSQKFSLDIIKFCDTLPRDARTQETAGQLQDAATSVAMNYRATCRARSDAEFIAKICITVEEADEAQFLKIFAASKRTVIRRVAAKQQASQRPRRESRNR